MSHRAEKLSIREWAALYISKGFQVVPLDPGSKAARGKEWLSLVFKPEDFNDNDNIGIRSVNGLVIIDCDSVEAVGAAAHFLPKSGAVYGRPSKPRSKWLYRSVFEKIQPFKDLETGEMFIEIRANHQDVAPPSVHPSGERVAWDGELGEIPEVEPEVLLRSVRLIASAVYIVRNYAPSGGRHDWTLALAGTLRQLGITHEEAEKLITFACNWVRDAKLDDRLTEVRTTYARPDDDPIKAAKALVKLTTKAFVHGLRHVWGSSTSAFILDAKGEKILHNHQENIRRALKKMNVELSYDQFAGRALVKWNEYRGLLDDAIALRIRFEIENKYHFLPEKQHYLDVIEDAARMNAFHPVRDYLATLKWDEKPRLDEWLIHAGGAADTKYVRAVSSLVLIAAVRRVMQPGAKFDELLILESSQGMFKSSALRLLCPNVEWFSDDLPLNVDAKQVIERTKGKWIIETPELSGMHKSQAEQLKGMLSRQVDGPVRMAYGRLSEERPRQWVPIGTTNSHTYLKDVTGNRRFWPVRVKRFDLEWIKNNREQLWAEAKHREELGESIRLDPSLYADAALQQERRRQSDPWEETLTAAFAPNKQHRVTSGEIWDILGVPIERRDERGNERIANVMQQLGFRRMTMRRDVEPGNTYGKVVKGWGRDVLSGTPDMLTEE